MNRGSQIFETDPDGALGKLAWDDFRIFLGVVEAGSIKAATKLLSCSHNTVRAHVKRLEDIVGAPLLHRQSSGISLTTHGQRLKEIALEMKAASRGLSRSIKAAETKPLTEMRVTVTEGLGTFWMVPRIARFHDDNADLLLFLECSMTSGDGAHDGDFSVQLERPKDDALVCTRLGTLHLMPFASADYLNRNGRPADIQDALGHRWVLQVADQVRTDLLTAFAGDDLPPQLIALKTNSSSAHYWAISKGIGMGILPTYARAITGNILPLDMGLQLRRDIWLVYHPDVRQQNGALKVIEWIKDSFDNNRYPWFSANFLHPDNFEGDFSGTNVVKLFAGFMDIPA